VIARFLDCADASARRGDHEQAATFFEAAVAASADRTPEPRIAYAIFLAETEDDAAAEEQLLAAWNVSRRVNSREARALVCYNLAVLLGRRRDHLRARQFQQLALGAWLETEMPGPLPLWLRRLTAAQWLTSDDEPEAWRLMQAGAEERPHDAEYWLDAAQQAENGEAAIERLERAAEGARDEGDGFGEALAHETLGAAWRRMRRWHEAADAFRQAEHLHDGARRFHARRRCQRRREELRSLRALLDGDPHRN